MVSGWQVFLSLQIGGRDAVFDMLPRCDILADGGAQAENMLCPKVGKWSWLTTVSTRQNCNKKMI